MSQINLITWSKTNQMHDMLVYDGHMYQYCKPNVADDYYRCCQSRSKVMAKCSASINISKDKTRVTKEPTAHNHLKQSASAPIVKRLRNNTKLRVINEPKNKPNTILLEEVGKSCREDNLEIDDGSAKLIPNYNGFKRSLYRYRNKVKPIEPKVTDEINLTDYRFINTNDAKRYKLFDTLDDTRMICYASNIGLEILSKSTEWHADGTFKSAPRKYKQLYHIHAW
jgi:hypothetical protein